MDLDHYTVTQVRAAATCPRIHYFDAAHTRASGSKKPTMTRIWTAGNGEAAAGGAMFHRVVERFNRQALHAPDVHAAVERAEAPAQLTQDLLKYINATCIDLVALSKKTVPLRIGFTRALHLYIGELAQILTYGRSRDIAPGKAIEFLFGDSRKRVDVTFHVADGARAHVTGAIDYVFHDWRVESTRIVDYKLTPATHPNKDLFQIYTYALMHHHQHRTRPRVTVFYLHPERVPFERSWEEVEGEQHKVYSLLASMVGWARYDEKTGAGLKPPGDLTYCSGCRWNRGGECEARLGPKQDGGWDHRWEKLGAANQAAAPQVDVVQPPAPAAAEELAEDDEPEVDDVGEVAPPPAVGGPDREPAGAVDAGRAAKAAPLPLEMRPARPDVPPLSLFLGTEESGGAPVAFPAADLRTHVAVVGAAGSGKTWMAKVLAEEAIRNRIPVLAIDPQGDLVQFLSRRPETEIPPELIEHHREFWELVEPRVFTPGTSHGLRLSLDPIRVASPDDLARIADPQEREEEQQAILSSVASNLVSLASIGGEKQAQQTFVFQLLGLMSGKPTIGLREIVAAIQEPEPLGIDQPDYTIRKAERQKLARALNAYVSGPASNLFVGGERLDLDRMIAPSHSGRVPLNVVYLNALTDDGQKQFFVGALAAEIYRWMVTSLEPNRARPNLLFYLDEARDYIPAGTARPPAKDPLIRLFTQGRKFGVGCLLCTQSPRSVDYNVFGNCSTKLIGRLEASQDVERVVEWFATTGGSPPWIAARKGATRGSFVARWPDMPTALEGRELRSRALYSAHEGAWSPERVKQAVDRSELRPGPLGT
jgi:DNA helicase HerA-like ATPase